MPSRAARQRRRVIRYFAGPFLILVAILGLFREIRTSRILSYDLIQAINSQAPSQELEMNHSSPSPTP